MSRSGNNAIALLVSGIAVLFFQKVREPAGAGGAH